MNLTECVPLLYQTLILCYRYMWYSPYHVQCRSQVDTVNVMFTTDISHYELSQAIVKYYVPLIAHTYWHCNWHIMLQGLFGNSTYRNGTNIDNNWLLDNVNHNRMRLVSKIFHVWGFWIPLSCFCHVKYAIKIMYNIRGWIWPHHHTVTVLNFITSD